MDVDKMLAVKSRFGKIGGGGAVIMENSTSLEEKVEFVRYNGCIHPDHMLHHIVFKTPVLQRNGNPLEMPDLKDRMDFQRFHDAFQRQIEMISETYKPKTNGDMKVVIRFGRLYLMNVDADRRRLGDLYAELEKQGMPRVRPPALMVKGKFATGASGNVATPIGLRAVSRLGKKFKHREGIYKTTTKRYISSFYPVGAGLNGYNRLVQLLDELQFKEVKVETEFKLFPKYVVGMLGVTEYTLDEEFKLTSVKKHKTTWLSVDICRRRSQNEDDIPDVRIQIISGKESRSSHNPLPPSAGQTKLLSRMTNGSLRFNTKARFAINWVREKKVTTYTYADKTEGCCLDGAVVEISDVKEYFNADKEGVLLDQKPSRTELAVGVPVHDEFQTGHPSELAKELWMLALTFGDEFAEQNHR